MYCPGRMRWPVLLVMAGVVLLNMYFFSIRGVAPHKKDNDMRDKHELHKQPPAAATVLSGNAAANQAAANVANAVADDRVPTPAEALAAAFPCPSKRPPSILNVINSTMHPITDFPCVSLAKLQPDTKICIHNVKDDIWVSGAIAKGGYWEGDNVNFLIKLLTEDPELNLIDIGANIGQYSMLAAHMGRQVLAVEARLLHIHMIHRAATLNGFHKNMTIIHNALSDGYTHVELATYQNNQGGTHIKEDKQKTKKNGAVQVRQDMSADSILMDDLTDLVHFKKAVMKIDIEGFEYRAFHCPHKLFAKVSIPIVMMEWNALKAKPAADIEPILTWFQKQDYEVYALRGTSLTLKLYTDWKNWTFDVIFRHKAFKSKLFDIIIIRNR